MSDFGLSEDILELIKGCLRHRDIKHAVIYGSRAMGTYKDYSDIDIAVMDNNFTPHNAAILKDALDELDMIYSCDITAYNHINNNEGLIEHINKFGKTLINE